MKAESLPEGLRAYNEKTRKEKGAARLVYFDPRSQFPFILRYLPKKGYAKNPSSRQLLTRNVINGLYRIFYHLIYPVMCRLPSDPPGVSTGPRPPEPYKIAGRFVHSNFLRILAGFESVATKIPDERLIPDEPTIEKVAIGKNNNLSLTIATPRQSGYTLTIATPHKSRYKHLFIFIYISVQYVVRQYWHLAAIAKIKSGRKNIRICLDHFNGGKRRWGKEEIPLSLLAGGIIRLKATIVALPTDKDGAIESIESDEYKVTLPKPSKMTSAQRRLRNRISTHQKKIRQAIHRRKMQDGSMDLELEQRREKGKTPAEIAANKKWVEEHKDDVIEYQKKWRKKHKKGIKKYQKKWQIENREHIRQWGRGYYAKNLEEMRAYGKAKYQKHKKKILARQKRKRMQRKMLA